MGFCAAMLVAASDNTSAMMANFIGLLFSCTRRRSILQHRRLAARHGQGFPAIGLKMLCQQNDLTDVRSRMREITIDGLHHGMRLLADINRARQIGICYRLERAEDTLPSAFPHF